MPRWGRLWQRFDFTVIAGAVPLWLVWILTGRSANWLGYLCGNLSLYLLTSILAESLWDFLRARRGLEPILIDDEEDA